MAMVWFLWGSDSQTERKLEGARFPCNPSVADLALAQRDGAQFPGELHDISKLVEVSSGVGAGGQNKDKRDRGRRLLEDRRQVRGLEEEMEKRAV